MTTTSRTARTAGFTAPHPSAIRLVGACVGALALVFALPGSAAAHVSLHSDTTVAGASALLTLNVPHGCDGAPTTRVAVQVPADLATVTSTVNPGWTVAKRIEELAQPVTTAQGTVLTSRVVEVVWTARVPLADGYRDTLSLQVPLPVDGAGRVLVFPTVQTCTTGEIGWTQVPASGQDADALEHPAPTVTVTPAEPEDDDAGAGVPGVVTTPGADGTNLWAAVASAGPASTGGLIVSALGLVAGVTALVRSRKVDRNR